MNAEQIAEKWADKLAARREFDVKEIKSHILAAIHEATTPVWEEAAQYLENSAATIANMATGFVRDQDMKASAIARAEYYRDAAKMLRNKTLPAAPPKPSYVPKVGEWFWHWDVRCDRWCGPYRCDGHEGNYVTHADGPMISDNNRFARAEVQPPPGVAE